MILVLLGTQDKPFNRLLDAIQEEIKKGTIKDKVIVQAGCTKYDSKDMELFDLLPTEQLYQLIKEAKLIITHGGVGSIMESIRNDKPVIATPRLKEYGEHVNNHQVEIICEFANQGYIIPLYELKLIKEALKTATIFKTKKYKSNTKKFVHMIEKYIDKATS